MRRRMFRVSIRRSGEAGGKVPGSTPRVEKA